MTTNEPTTAPDLASLAQHINTEHEAARVAFTKGFEHAVKAGELLIEAKAAVEHGQWLPWLKANCTVSERTAQLYMKVVKGKPELEAKNATVADLTLRGAVELLSEPNYKFDDVEEPGKSVVDYRNAKPASHLVPPDGHMLIGTVDNLTAYIMPSNHDGFYFIAWVSTEPGSEAAFATGLMSAVSLKWIEQSFKVLGLPIERTTWMAKPYGGPKKFNVWLFSSEREYIRSINTKRDVAEFDRRLAEEAV